MKKLLIIAIAFLLLPLSAMAANTDNIGLQRPNAGTTRWDTILNSNFTLLDTYIGAARGSKSSIASLLDVELDVTTTGSGASRARGTCASLSARLDGCSYPDGSPKSAAVGSEWTAPGGAINRDSGSVFSVSGDYRTQYNQYRCVKFTTSSPAVTVYGYITVTPTYDTRTRITVSCTIPTGTGLLGYIGIQPEDVPKHGNTNHTSNYSVSPHGDSDHSVVYARNPHDNSSHSVAYLAATPHSNSSHSTEMLVVGKPRRVRVWAADADPDNPPYRDFISTAGATPLKIPVTWFEDGYNQGITMSWTFPADMNMALGCTFEISTVIATTNSTNAVRIQVPYVVGGDSYVLTSDTPNTSNTSTVTCGNWPINRQTLISSMGVNTSSMNNGQTLFFGFKRLGTDGADTFTGSFGLLYFDIIYYVKNS